MNGAELFALVEAYASLGDHRTGTPVDAATRAWLAGQLAVRGLAVEERRVTFPRWDAEWAAGVPAAPLYYSAFGAVAGRAHVERLEPAGPAAPLRLGGALERAAGSAALVVSPGTGAPGPFAVNVPVAPGAGLPVLVVSDDDLDRVERVELRAGLTRGETADLVAHVPGPGEPLLLTTPMNGWYRCAGERGTGIAILLELLDRLTGRCALTVHLTCGHELDHFGARLAVRRNTSSYRAIVHIGASVAVTEPAVLRLAARGVEVPGASPGWLGEGAIWQTLGTPIISWAGANQLFHTPHDLPHAATTPDLLSERADAMADVVERLLAAT